MGKACKSCHYLLLNTKWLAKNASSCQFALFTDILAGFTFNNRVLRLPAIVLLNTTFRPGNSRVSGSKRLLEDEELCCSVCS